MASGKRKYAAYAPKKATAQSVSNKVTNNELIHNTLITKYL